MSQVNVIGEFRWKRRPLPNGRRYWILGAAKPKKYGIHFIHMRIAFFNFPKTFRYILFFTIEIQSPNKRAEFGCRQVPKSCRHAPYYEASENHPGLRLLQKTQDEMRDSGFVASIFLSLNFSLIRATLIDHSNSLVRCHRCKVLSIDCSYEKTRKPVASNQARVTAGLPELDTAASIRLWSFVVERQDLDWSAPISAIQQLATLPSSVNATTTEFVNKNLSLSAIMPEGRIDYLIDLFDTQYTPWLNFQPIRNSPNPLVDIACSAVAARHLDGASGQEVRIRLQNLTRESIAQMIFKPGAPASVEAVQCLLILSLWGPFGVAPEIPGWDTQTLISTAVRMAVELRLNHASVVVNDTRKQEFPDTVVITEASERARLWIALANAESMLCLGTGRTPLSRWCPEDHLLAQFPLVLSAQSDLRNLRLGLTARSLDLLREGVSICLGSDKQKWVQDMKSVLERLKRESRHLKPLPVVMNTDQFYFHVLHILNGICRLLILYRAFSEAGASIAQPLGPHWREQFAPGGTREGLASRLARDTLQTSEALLVSFLATPTTRLCTAPDAYFHMVTLAAGHLVAVKFLVLRISHGRRLLLGASDLLLARTVITLHRAACGPGHAAQRCALLVQAMLKKWCARDGDREFPTTLEGNTRQTDGIAVADCGQQADSAWVTSLLSLQSPVPSRFRTPSPTHGTTSTPPFFDVEFMFPNSISADDAAFWDTMMPDQLTW
ncbi:hypothetical protein B0H12DRAFT_1070529 [Mycena haematopus]|nr:hypothetical protein B0H12DRAFT_1070529 [Mycena haematopus]